MANTTKEHLLLTKDYYNKKKQPNEHPKGLQEFHIEEYLWNKASKWQPK